MNTPKETVEAIVLTLEQYREDVILFGEWLSKNYFTHGEYGNYMDKDDLVWTSAELFDLYQKENKEKAV